MNINAMNDYAFYNLQQNFQGIIHELSKNSTFLDTTHQNFMQYLSDYPGIRIISLYETLKTPTMKEVSKGNWERVGPAEESVSKESAILNMRTIEYCISVRMDHRNMARLSTSSNYLFSLGMEMKRCLKRFSTSCECNIQVQL
jgi:hypothetical protein